MLMIMHKTLIHLKCLLSDENKRLDRDFHDVHLHPLPGLVMFLILPVAELSAGESV